MFEKYGVENCKIVLIESFSCNSKQELEAREAFCIRNNKCVNKQVPTRTKKQYYQDNIDKFKEYKKQYRQDNVDKIKEKYTCECGSICGFVRRSSHEKTQKHINYINSLL